MSKKGSKQSPETIAKRVKANTGKKRTPEQCQHLKDGLNKEGVQDKRKKTNVERYGGESPLSSPDILDKKNQTCLTNYGGDYFELWSQKCEKTQIERYGSWFASTDEGKKKNSDGFKNGGNEKRIANNLRKYGVENVIQDPEIFMRMCKSLGTWKFPNKWEVKKLEELKQEYPNLEYVGNGKMRVNSFGKVKYPDLYDPDTNTIFELNGNYWHSKEKTGVEEKFHEMDLIYFYKEAGYNAQIIWEKEI